jgi:hypothetical protein
MTPSAPDSSGSIRERLRSVYGPRELEKHRSLEALSEGGATLPTLSCSGTTANERRPPPLFVSNLRRISGYDPANDCSQVGGSRLMTKPILVAVFLVIMVAIIVGVDVMVFKHRF